MHVERLERGAVHLRVLLGRSEQPRDAPDGLGDLVEQAVGLQGPHGIGQADLQVWGRQHLRKALEPTQIHAGGDQRGCDVPSTGDAVVLQPVGELLLAIGCVKRRQDRGLPAAIEGASSQVGNRFELAGGEFAANHLADLLSHLGQHVSQPRARRAAPQPPDC